MGSCHSNINFIWGFLSPHHTGNNKFPFNCILHSFGFDDPFEDLYQGRNLKIGSISNGDGLIFFYIVVSEINNRNTQRYKHVQ